MEERGEVLNLTPPGAELELAPAVGAYPALLAVVVRLEEREEGPEARY